MGQHTGSEGKETAWFSVDPHHPPIWIESNGGSLDQAFSVLRSLSHRR